ncbi:MAG TPA: hypothetical protein VFP70_04905 [Burkholderiales bacterium]|nr:hypothetical protein [Burkholderiales bacterium]
MDLYRVRIFVAALALFAATSASAAPFANVPNGKSGTPSVIDTAVDEVVGDIKAGAEPRGTAASKDGKRMCLSDQPANIDIEKPQMIAKLDLGDISRGVVIR